MSTLLELDMYRQGGKTEEWYFYSDGVMADASL